MRDRSVALAASLVSLFLERLRIEGGAGGKPPPSGFNIVSFTFSIAIKIAIEKAILIVSI